MTIIPVRHRPDRRKVQSSCPVLRSFPVNIDVSYRGGNNNNNNNNNLSRIEPQPYPRVYQHNNLKGLKINNKNDNHYYYYYNKCYNNYNYNNIYLL